METFFTSVEMFWSHIPFSTATWFVIFILSFIVWLFARANKNPNSPIRWEDMLIDSSTNRTSPYKLGFLVGAIVGTWVVIALMDRDKLSIDIFGAYLAFLVGGAGWVEWVKHGKKNEDQGGGYYGGGGGGIDDSWKLRTKVGGDGKPPIMPSDQEELSPEEMEAPPEELTRDIKGKGKGKK